MESEIDQQFLLSKEWTSTENDIFARVNLLVCYFACKVFQNHRTEPEEALIKRFDRLLKDTLFGENSEGLLQDIRESNLTSVCGKILRNGEPAYCCRDCETDPTCVLCMDCFDHSEHRQHHYKLITSSGSGCCDCGDPEAWHSGVHCSIHQPNQSSSKDSQMDQFSPQLVARAWNFLKAVLTFCRDILCLGEDESPPSAYLTRDVEKLISEQQYITLLYNDELHTYDDVIGALTRTDVGMDQMGAVAMATNVDSLGRGFTCVGLKEECERQKIAINRRLRTPLTVKVFPSAIVSLQQCALYLLMWTKELAGNSAALRRVVSEVLLETGQSKGEENQSILDCFFVKNASLWIEARMGWQTLIMATIFLDPDHKKDLAISLAKNFSCLLRGYFEDSHHYEVSAANLTVQLFTVPSLCHMLVAEHNLLKTVLQTLYDILNKFRNPSTGKLELAQRGYSSGRMAYIIADMRYVLRNRPTTWTPGLRSSFVESYQVFLNLLDLIQGVDPVKRQHYHHVPMEPEWEALFNLCILLLEAIEQVVEWCQSDSSVLHQTVRLTLKQIQISCGFNKMRFRNKPVNKPVVGTDNMELIEFDIQQESVSIHQPLVRLLAGLLTGAHKHNTTIPGLLQTPVSSSREFLFLLELPLRVIVMTSQVLAGMWKRNGYSLINQTINYRYHSCRTQMYDKDLLLLQAMAAVMEPNKFMYALVYRFRLQNWISSMLDLLQLMIFFYSTIDYDPVERGEPNSDAVRFLLSEAEEFFYLLITIFGERFIPGVSNVTQAECLKQEIIHQLYIAPLSHSELLKNLKLHEDKELKKIVLEVAEFKKPTNTSKGQYILKPELEKQFNPFFYHYSKVQLSKAEEAHRKKVKAKGGAFKMPSMAPPKPPAFLPPFQDILRLVQCPVLHHVLHGLFSRAATPGLKYWSDKLLHEAVYLCGLMLLEESPSENDQFSRYAAGLTGTSKGGSILSLLETILQNKRGEEFCYLTQWVVQQLKLVRDSGGRGQQQVSHDEVDMTDSDQQKEDNSKEQKQQQAAAQRRKVMAEMAALQKKFLQSNRQVLSEIDTGSNIDEVTTTTTAVPKLVAVGLHSVSIQTQTPIPLHCILCQAVEKDAADCEKQFVLGMRIQRSTVLKRTSRAIKLNKEVAIDYLLNNVTLTQGVYSSSCGHGMHMECWRRFHDSRVTELRQSDLLFQRRSAVNYEAGEFLCPLCQYYCNTILPIHPDPLNQRPASADTSEDTTFEQWRKRLHSLLEYALQQTTASSGSNNTSVRAPAGSSAASVPNRLAELLPKYLKLEKQSSGSYSRSSSTSSQGVGTASSYSQAVFTRGYNTYPNEADPRVPVSVWATCAYTIQCLECQSDVSGKSLLTFLHSRQVNCLRAMVRSASCATSVCQATEPAALGKHLSKLLNTVIPVGGCFSELPCVLDLDPFSIMVNLHFSIMSMLDALDPDCKMVLRPLIAVDDQYIVRIAVAMQLVQYLLTTESQPGEAPCGSDSTGVVGVWQNLRNWTLGSSCDKDQSSITPSADVLLAGCRNTALPLLQRAALFFHCCNGVELPQEDPITYETLLSYLCLPAQIHNLLTVEHGAGLGQLIQMWCQHRSVVQQISSLQAAAPPLPCMMAKVQPLYTLPQDYSELIKKASNFRCPKFQSSNRDSTAVIMCLICGELLCSNCYRCMVTAEDGGEAIGNFTNHVRECGGSVGMGLWILECYMVLMNAMDLEDVRGCILTAPYLDEYGESDIGLRSGNPLKLNEDLWKEFQQYWYQHTIIEKITATNDQERKFVVFSWSKL